MSDCYKSSGSSPTIVSSQRNAPAPPTPDTTPPKLCERLGCKNPVRKTRFCCSKACYVQYDAAISLEVRLLAKQLIAIAVQPGGPQDKRVLKPKYFIDQDGHMVLMNYHVPVSYGVALMAWKKMRDEIESRIRNGQAVVQSSQSAQKKEVSNG